MNNAKTNMTDREQLDHAVDMVRLLSDQLKHWTAVLTRLTQMPPETDHTEPIDKP